MLVGPPPHHLEDRHLVALEHLTPQLDVVEPFVGVADNVPVISIRDGVTISEVSLVIVTEGIHDGMYNIT